MTAKPKDQYIPGKRFCLSGIVLLSRFKTHLLAKQRTSLLDRLKADCLWIKDNYQLFLLVVFTCIVIVPGNAWAMDTERVTAQPNDSSKKIVYGGIPTRITWVGVVSDYEEVRAITLKFPKGSATTDQTYIKIQEMVMDNPSRPFHNTDLSYTVDIDSQRLVIEFDTYIRSNNQLYIEIYFFCLPEQAGLYTITGTYTNSRGLVYDLAPQPSPMRVEVLTQSQKLVNSMNEMEWVQKWNSVTFLRVFFNPSWVVASIPILFFGWLRSLMLVAIGFPIAIPIGLGVSFMRMSRFSPLRFISSIWVNVIRGTPLFLQIYLAYFGLPHLGIHLDPYTRAIIVLAMNSSAYLAEIFRAGIQSINKGQFEAANSLGMNGFQTMFFVIIPQTIRRVIPTMTSEFILLYKDTSLLAAVGIDEQMMAAKSLVNIAGGMTPYVVSACYYLVVTLPLIKVISSLEKRLAASEGRTEPPEDLRKRNKNRRAESY
ncbi:MAG: amino acid ABC transporter permease [Coriobacteriia bacterium]|nr:amino acid ABC transporter permease [Coriobacteriia bacterium]